MTVWKEWTLGNVMRMTKPYKARTIQEAWRKGCKIINDAFPSEQGRIVYLTLHIRNQIPAYVTKYIVDQMKLPPKKRYFSNLSAGVSQDVVVAYGLSKEPLVDTKGLKL